MILVTNRSYLRSPSEQRSKIQEKVKQLMVSQLQVNKVLRIQQLIGEALIKPKQSRVLIRVEVKPLVLFGVSLEKPILAKELSSKLSITPVLGH